MYLGSKPSDSSREISKSLYYECQVRDSFCERSEEYDVKTIAEPPTNTDSSVFFKQITDEKLKNTDDLRARYEIFFINIKQRGRGPII